MLRHLVIVFSGNIYSTKKNKNTDLNEFELREMNKSHSISTSYTLTHRSTANSCHSLAQRQLPQLPNTSHDQPDSPFLHHSSKGNTDIYNVHPLKIKESPKMKIGATPETVKMFWKIQIPHDLMKYSLIKPSECIPYTDTSTFYDLKIVL